MNDRVLIEELYWMFVYIRFYKGTICFVYVLKKACVLGLYLIITTLTKLYLNYIQITFTSPA